MANKKKTMTDYLEDIVLRRDLILEEFSKAYLAGVVPQEKMTLDWIMNHIEFVEQSNDDRTEMRWFFRLK